MNQQRITGRLAPWFAFAAFGLAFSGRAEEPSGAKKLTNPFFAMNFEMHDPQLASALAKQAQWLKELRYDGKLYLGPLDGIRDTFRVMDEAGLPVLAAAVTPYNISVDPNEPLPANLKQAVRQLKGRETILLIQFVSKIYDRGSPEGDARAVELGRELADLARDCGVRVAIYHHQKIWCERIDHSVRIAKKCGSKNLGVCFNLSHWLWTDPHGDLDSLVRAAMPHLLLVTVNGFSPKGSFETLDRSSYDVGGFLKPFVEAGYHGAIGLQCCSLKGDPRENLIRCMNGWRRISAQLAGAAKDPAALGAPEPSRD